MAQETSKQHKIHVIQKMLLKMESETCGDVVEILLLDVPEDLGLDGVAR